MIGAWNGVRLCGGWCGGLALGFFFWRGRGVCGCVAGKGDSGCAGALTRVWVQRAFIGCGRRAGEASRRVASWDWSVPDRGVSVLRPMAPCRCSAPLRTRFSAGSRRPQRGPGGGDSSAESKVWRQPAIADHRHEPQRDAAGRDETCSPEAERGRLCGMGPSCVGAHWTSGSGLRDQSGHCRFCSIPVFFRVSNLTAEWEITILCDAPE